MFLLLAGTAAVMTAGRHDVFADLRQRRALGLVQL
jgi:hypothetical protein